MEAYERLETEWAAFNGLDPDGMVACSSGTAALHLIWECSGIEKDHEVVCPNLTMVAVPRAVVLGGLRPVFVDCYGDTLNMEPGLVEDIITWRTQGVCVVHTYGRRAQMDKLASLCDKYDQFLAEDLSEAHGVKPHPLTDAAAWSFYRNKVVAGEEGGCVWFRDKKAADKARSLRCQGFTDAHDFNHIPRGHNYRLANVLAELILGVDESSGLTGLDNYPENRDRRRRLEQAYNEQCPLQWRMPVRDVPWVYDLRIMGMTPDVQNRAVKALQAGGVAARHCFKLMTEQPEFKGCRSISRGVGSVRSREVLYLPLPPWVSAGTAEQAFTILRQVLQDTPVALPPIATPTLAQAERTPAG